MKNIKRILSVALVVFAILTLFTACGPTPQEQIVGTWKDSTGSTGYTFNENGTCSITYIDVNISILGFEYDGSIDGVYTIEKRADDNYYVTITYTVLSKSVTEDYMFVVEDAALTLTDTADNTVTTYIRATDTTTTAATVAQ